MLVCVLFFNLRSVLSFFWIFFSHLRLDPGYSRERLLLDQQGLDDDPRRREEEERGFGEDGAETFLFRYPAKAEKEKRLKEIEEELVELRKKILRMDSIDVITQAPVCTPETNWHWNTSLLLSFLFPSCLLLCSSLSILAVERADVVPFEALLPCI